MSRVFGLVLVLVFCAPLFLHASEESEVLPPSDGARGMCGAMGKIPFQPDDWEEGTTSHWVDSDGVDPETPGCHVGMADEDNPNGRKFGEACLPSGLLVESNPGAGEFHSHSNDTGHPDTFDCTMWCQGQGATKGACVGVVGPAPCETSAKCTCNSGH